ncbi:pRiA4b ORF-3-like protein [Blastococcus sp. DSM 46786]|uniref:plasmid pRiA4b ORF-3 family protein n=1 Tax=Blastococcus sp. DSM 46786 TaxID=1798227 RepID=UPI0008BB1828|nr:plasmid pRiA4b ORF-3 family protein [Blastococcus sp. DSM 46786]SEM14204.1 pRiA4b ORF-3-like protein [Blastococcus sp. DSM 46786]
MSPKSRGRTPRNRSRRSTGPAQASPGVRLLQELDHELREADTLSAEITVSAVLGAARLPRHDGPAAVRAPVDLVADLIRQAGKVRRPTSLGLLRCLASLTEGNQGDADFRVGDVRYGDPEQLSDGWLDDTRDEARARLAQVLPRTGDRLRYTYDFGDDWEHEVLVESVEPAPGTMPIQCLAGRRAGPPEDCGGTWGFAELCQAAQHPDDPAAVERLEELGHPFDPAHFDLEAVDDRLRSLGRR